MNKDEQLLKLYLDLHNPESYPWNMSPESLYIEYVTRHYIRYRITVFEGMKACNIGIGVGEWDDYLGYTLLGKGTLTSVDIDAEIFDLFRYRQWREGHPNPSTVVCMDVLNSTLSNDLFDLVTIIGSTVKQTGEYEKTFHSCFDLLHKNGVLVYMDFLKNHTDDEFVQFIQSTPHRIEDISRYNEYPQVDFLICRARK
ncbi:class I SAM-dependent methyltransferase [Alicyclobacillus fastidiosus]|uniref:class I SAM-dependent methyltransferase n=1 Tax=Alicyclobacillus fastidiosus TaxID=392011 RepID=UPI0023E9FC8E|nr:class I SAM-dependent methyltransferase [Alicyclobacillus fastidiosus]GMA66004.1 hypothetical protein GCM10025859_64460 [Alicyclobacillus fastidiosus]